MNLNFQAGTSPLAARMNPAIYTVLLFALIVAGSLTFLFFLLNKKKEKEKTPEWIEAQSKRKTKRRDVEIFSEKYKLKPEEENLLWKICKKYGIPNILFAIKDIKSIDPYFEKFYEQNKNLYQQDINLMFRLKFRVERIFAASEIITSTKLLSKNSKISEIFPDGTKIPFSIYENTKDYLSIRITPEFLESDKKPENLEKVAFTFLSKTGMQYAFVSRILRYETEGNVCQMIISHSNDLITKQRRHFKRLTVNEKCRIASVSEETDRKNEKKYVPAEERIECALTNISGGGCCISTTLPIKENQMTYIELSLADGEYGIFGRIVKTRKSATPGLYNLHIKFDGISVEAQNKILAKVYGYN